MPGGEVLAPEHGHVVAAAGKAHPAPAGLARRAVRLGDLPHLRVRRDRDRRRQVVDDLDDLARNGKAEAGLVGLVERLPEPGRAVLVEGLEGDRQLELVVLAQVAHLERAGDLQVVAIALLLEIGHAFAHQLAQHLVGDIGGEPGRGQLGGALAIDPGIGQGEAVGRELAGMVGHDGVGDPHLGDQLGRVQRAGAAEREQGEITRIEAALDQHGVQRADHVVVGDPHDRHGGLVGAVAERLADARPARARRPPRRAPCCRPENSRD